MSFENFRYTTRDGDEIVLPPRVKVKVLRAVARADSDIDAMLGLIDAVASKKMRARIDEMDADELVDMFEKYSEAIAGGASVGESESSAS